MKSIVKAIFSGTLSLSLAAIPAAVATAGALFSLAASMVGAAEISQPGDLLYPLRRPALELQLTLTTDPETRAQLENLLAFAPVPEVQPGGDADSAPAATPGSVSGGNNPLPIPTLGNAAAPPPTVSVPPTQPAGAGAANSAAVGSPAIAPGPTEDNGSHDSSVGDDHGGDLNANSNQSNSGSSDSSQSSGGSDSNQSSSISSDSSQSGGGEIGNDHSGGDHHGGDGSGGDQNTDDSSNDD